jgi:hypothetical protein
MVYQVIEVWPANGPWRIDPRNRLGQTRSKKTMKHLKRTFLMAGLCMTTFALLQPANAGLITTIPIGATTTTFTVTGFTANLTGATVNGFTVTGMNFQDGNATFSLGSNGDWSSQGNFSYLSAGPFPTNFFRIDLGALYSTAGGFFNYAPGAFPGSDSTLTAIAADGTTVLETDDLVTSAPISTPGAHDAGAFRGITRDTPTIRFLQVSGPFTIEHTITAVSPSGPTVPEPSTFLLVLLPLAGLGLYVKRRGQLQ